MASSAQTLGKKLVLACVSLVVCLGLSECVFRWYAEGQYRAALEKWHEHPDPMIQVVRDDPVQFVLIPDNKRTMVIPAGDTWPEVKWTFSVNKGGFRGGALDLDRSPEELRILILGDSYAFGFAVDDHETLPYQLEQLLNNDDNGDSNRRVRVINGGVPGTNSVQHYHLLKRAFEKVKPHVVLLVYVTNDAEPLHHVPNPPSYVYRHYTLWLLGEARDAINRMTGTEIFQVTKPVDEPDYLESFHPDNHRWRESKEAIKQMADFCRDSRCTFGVVIYPDLTQPFTFEYGYQLIHASVVLWGKEHDYPVMDLFKNFYGLPNHELAVHGDWHPNGKAHGIAAKETAKYVRLAIRQIK